MNVELLKGERCPYSYANKWRRLVLNGRITFTKLELVPAFLFIKPATKRDLLVNPIAAGTC